MKRRFHALSLQIPLLRHIRRSMIVGVLLAPICFVAGCNRDINRPFVETYSVNPETAARLAGEVKLYETAEIASLKYTPIKAIESWSCQARFWDPDATREDALAQLRLKASSFGANGILDVQCSSQGTSLVTNCWSTVKCVGTAIKVDGQ